MDKKSIELVKNLKPYGLPKGSDVLEEGVAIGNSFKAGKSKFLEEKGYHTFQEYKDDCSKKGIVMFEILLGLSSLEEQIEGIKAIYEHGQRTGLDIRTVQCIPSGLVALPKEYRDNAPKPTSYVMETEIDYLRQATAAPVMVLFEDQILSCPNAIETTMNALKAGSQRCGLISQFIWSQPGYTDDAQHMIDMVKSIGMVKSKYDEGFICDSFMDDGFPGFGMDVVTYVGYALLEHYIVSDLCGARHQISYGNLLTETIPRLAYPLAIYRLLNKPGENPIGYVNGATIYQWDHDIDANYGPAAQEMLLEILFERHYKMGLMINPVSITEKVSVPTLQDLLNIYSVGSRLREEAPSWDLLMDWTKIEECAEILMREGKAMFENTLDIMSEAGIDIKDPLEMFMVLKKLNPSKFESTFHHNKDEHGTVIPFVPSVLGRQTLDMTKVEIQNLYNAGLKGDELKNVKIVLASADTHTYGTVFMETVLAKFGAEVVNGGVDIDAASLLDLADEEDVDIIGISVHNGQGLDYAKQLMEISKHRGKEYKVFMGGMLNGMLPGNTEPCDVTDLINDTGVFATNDTFADIRMIESWNERAI